MKKKNLTLILIIVASFLLILNPSRSIASTYSGAWKPLDGNIFTVDLSEDGNPNDSFWLYSREVGMSESLLLFNRDNNDLGIAYVYFNDDGEDWYASTNDKFDDDDNLLLGEFNEFGFFFMDNQNNINNTYEITNVGTGGDFMLEDNQGSNPTGMVVLLTGAELASPIPSTVWIFGAGLVGLFGIRRKIKG